MRARPAVFAAVFVVVLAGAGCGSVGSTRPDASGSGGTGGSGGAAGTGGGAGGGGGQPGDGAAPDAPGDGGQPSDAPADTSGGGDGGGGASCGALPSGVVSWWHGDGDYSDSTGAVAGTSVGGVSFAAGAIGQAFILDGTVSSYVQMPDAAPLRITGALTLDAWVRPTAAAAGRIMDKIMLGGANGYLLDLVSGQIRVLVGADSLSSGVTVPVGVFSHIAGVYSGTALSVYLNGVLVATKTTTVAAIPSNNLPFRIGADSAGGTRFNGAVDEPRLFGRALSGVEIQSIYQAGSPAHCACVAPLAGLVSWWRGDGNLSDSRGTNTGTDSGGVAFNGGAVGAGISLNGAANSYVLVPDATTLQIGGPLTVEAWINPTALSGRIVDKIMAGGANGYYLDITTMTATGGGLLRFGVGNDNVSSAAPLTATRFSHVAGVYDGTTLSVYVNGARVANKTTLVTTVPTSTLPLRIGADSAGTTRFTGIIDEPRLYNRGLTADEVTGLYRAGAAARCAP